MPTEPTPPATPAEPFKDPFRGFAVYPRRATIDGGSGPVHMLVVVPDQPATAAALRNVTEHAHGSCRRELMNLRHEFFATGPGKILREKEQKLAEAEQLARDCAAEEARLRGEWRSAVASDSADDASVLEEQIRNQEIQCERMRVRLPVIREELARLQKQTANLLLAQLQRARDEYQEAAEQRLAVTRAKLTAAVNSAWPDWIDAQADVNGTSESLLGTSQLMFLASVAHEPPTRMPQGKDEEGVDHGLALLPDRPGIPPREQVQTRRPFGPPIPVTVLPDHPKPAAAGELVRTEFGTMMRTESGELVDVPTQPRRGTDDESDD